MFDDLRAQIGFNFSAQLPGGIVSWLTTSSPRVMKSRFETAMGLAVVSGRRFLKLQDLQRAHSEEIQRNGMGFLAER